MLEGTFSLELGLCYALLWTGFDCIALRCAGSGRVGSYCIVSCLFLLLHCNLFYSVAL